MIEKRKGIILDYDDVLVNYCSGVVSYAQTNYGLKLKGEANSYALHKSFDVSENLVHNILNNFNNNSYQFGLLDAIDDYVKGSVWMLRESFPDVDLFVVTKCGNSSQTVALRRVNCANLFGKNTFEDILFLNPDESKAIAFKKLKRTHDIICVVDDHIDNINTAIDCGIKPFVYERSHNVQYKNNSKYTFVSNWIDLYHEIERLIHKSYENGV